jgi:hypothetical protein
VPDRNRTQFVVTDITDRTEFIDADPITPTLIEHKVDEIIVDGQLEQSYNYIDYWFEAEDGRIRVRTYLDSIHEANLYPVLRLGPGGQAQMSENPLIRDAVLGYLTRRYVVIKELGATGYETIWMAAHAQRVLKYRGLATAASPG